MGIKNVIQSHLREVQTKFQDRFQTLDLEIKHRDLVISSLQYRIQELEEGIPNAIGSPNDDAIRNVIAGGGGGGSTGSSGDIAFVVSLIKMKLNKKKMQIKKQCYINIPLIF